MSIEKSTEFIESHTVPGRAELLSRRIQDLQLELRGTRIERLAERLYGELEQKGLDFRPPVYLSDEWGCPDRVPIIGVPFYLANQELTRLEDEFMEGVEAETDDQIMRYLRHEAGHAFNYAYQLYETEEWTRLFGPFTRPYSDDYTPSPFSRSFVRHLPAWYAQKHPDEDFAETFAVWLDPASNWREVYAQWGCLPKLMYIDRLASEIGRTPPSVTADAYDVRESFLSRTVAEHYRRFDTKHEEIPPLFDAALRDVFDGTPTATSDARGNAFEPAAEFLKRHRRAIVSRVFYWTGLNDRLIRALLTHFQERCSALGLLVERNRPDRLIEVVAFVTALCMNRLQTGEFIRK